MQINLDSYYKIGSSHKVCQDYTAISRETNTVVLSDGCSSAPHTDIGARLLAHSFLKHNNFCDPIFEAQEITDKLNLPIECLAATLLSVHLSPTHFEVNIAGDGTVVSRRNDSSLEIYNFRFSSGAPYYLYYNLESDHREQYVGQFGQELMENEEAITFFEKYPNGIITKTFPVEDYDMVAIFSDGIDTFYKMDGSIKWVEQLEIITNLMGFKSYGGEFVQRRCNKALKQGIKHWDDFSMGAIHLNESLH